MYGVGPYNPYAYQMLAQNGLQGPFMQTSMNQAAPAPQPQQSGPDWLQVPNIKQVEQVSVQPGGKAWVMVQNEPVFALKVADQMGLVTTSYYRFEKYDPEAAVAASSPTYITRDELEQRLAAFADSLKPQRNTKKEVPAE